MSRRAVIAVDVEIEEGETAICLAADLRGLLTNGSWDYLNPEVTVLDHGEVTP